MIVIISFIFRYGQINPGSGKRRKRHTIGSGGIVWGGGSSGGFGGGGGFGGFSGGGGFGSGGGGAGGSW